MILCVAPVFMNRFPDLERGEARTVFLPFRARSSLMKVMSPPLKRETFMPLAIVPRGGHLPFFFDPVFVKGAVSSEKSDMFFFWSALRCVPEAMPRNMSCSALPSGVGPFPFLRKSNLPGED